MHVPLVGDSVSFSWVVIAFRAEIWTVGASLVLEQGQGLSWSNMDE